MPKKAGKSKKQTLKKEKQDNGEQKGENSSPDEPELRNYGYMKSSVENTLKSTLKKWISEAKEDYLSELVQFKNHDMFNNFFQLYGRRYSEALLAEQLFLSEDQLQREFFDQFICLHLSSELPVVEEDETSKIKLCKDQLVLLYYMDVKSINKDAVAIELDFQLEQCDYQLLNGLFYLSDKFKNVAIVQNEPQNIILLQTELHDVINAQNVQKEVLDEYVTKRQLSKAFTGDKILSTFIDISSYLFAQGLTTVVDEPSQVESGLEESVESTAEELCQTESESSTFGFSASYFDEIESGIEEASESGDEEEEEEENEEEENDESETLTSDSNERPEEGDEDGCESEIEVQGAQNEQINVESHLEETQCVENAVQSPECHVQEDISNKEPQTEEKELLDPLKQPKKPKKKKTQSK